MSGAKLLPAQSGNSTATSATASGATPAGSVGGSPFDAILMLEEMAAAASDVGIDAGAAELGTEGGEVADTAADEGADDEDSIELDDPLAFLAGLIAISPHPQTRVTGHGARAGEGADALAAPSSGQAGSSGLSLITDADANPNTAPSEAKPADAAASAAARALAAQAALSTTDTNSPDDKAATRAVDLLTHTSRPAPTAADHAPIATHVRDPRWAEEFGTRIALLVNQRESIAAISLTPVDLGPVDVSVTVRDSQATIHFGAAQAETRALIEASLPKLRELLAAQGFQLTDASVSHGFTRQSKSDAPSIPRPTSVEDVTAVESRTVAMNGLLDLYA